LSIARESGTGVAPVRLAKLRSASPMSEITKRRGAFLPHWTRESAWYAVTFRLWDSLPQHLIECWLFERNNIVKTAQQMKRPLSTMEEQRLAHLYSEKVERYLNAGNGSCYMKDPRIALLMRNALFHFNDKRYSIAAWCVMPNHVHVVVDPFSRQITAVETAVPRSELRDILHSWKSFSSKEANKLLSRSGEIWQAEYYDHLIRDHADFRHAVSYVLNNPINAGLKNWKWVGLTETGKGLLGETSQ